MEPIVECMIYRSCSTTGEGPHWHHSTNSLLFVDIEAKFLHRWTPETNEKRSLHLDEMVSAVVPSKSGRYMITQRKSICHLDWETKKVKVLHTVEDGLQNRFNDMKCDPSGRLWAGTMPLNLQSMPRKQGALYSLETDGSLVKRLDDVTLSNGLAWIGDTMYYIDSKPGHIYAFDFCLENGNITNQRVVYEHKGEGFPDGMCTDKNDKLWVAFYGAGCIRQMNPTNGSVLRTINIPGARNVTSCCFGGPDYDELYVTTGTMLIPPEEQAINELAGSVFKLSGLGVKGSTAVEYGA